MPTYTEKLLGVRVSGDEKSAHNLCIKDIELDEFVLGPPEHASQRYSLKNSVFRNLRISGDFLVYEGACLENVVFEDVVCDDALTISNLAFLNRVRFVGNRGRKGLWIKPLDDFSVEPNVTLQQKYVTESIPSEYMVDITQFFGDDVEILGLPVHKVRFDNSRHFAIDSQWCDIPWEEHGIAKSSFWRMRFDRLALFEVETGIFELPTMRYKKYETAINDARILQNIFPGIIPAL